MTSLILNPNISLRDATEYMRRLRSKGYDCWFKTIANKDTGQSEVHIIVEDRYVTIINTRR